MYWIFLTQTFLSFISPLKTLKVVKREFVTFMVAKSLLTSLALCYLLCRGLKIRVVYSVSCVDRIVVVLLWWFSVDSEILHAMKAVTQSNLLEPRNKWLVFVIFLSLILTSIFIVLLVLILTIFILSIILHLCYFIATDC